MEQDMMFLGVLAGFGSSLETAHADSTVFTGAELLTAQVLDASLMQVYGPDLMPRQLSVLVSQWSKYYFMQLIPPVVVAVLVHGRCWPLWLDAVAFAVNERGLLDGVGFAGSTDAAAVVHPFATLLEHLQAVVTGLSGYGNVAPGVLWGNAGDYLETCLKQLAAVSDVSLDAGYALLNQRTTGNGRSNPLFNAISYIESVDGPRRRRRSCCLSHRVEWVGRCEHCPLSS